MDMSFQFSEDELSSAETESPSISGSPPTRFAQECIQYYREWYRSHETRIINGHVKPDQALLIVYSEAPNVEAGFPTTDISSFRTFRRSLSLEEGIATATENLKKIVKWDISACRADDIFQFISSNFQEESSFVVLLMSQRRILVHQNSEDIEEWIDNPNEILISTENNEITPSSIGEQINLFHKRCTETPKCWTARTMWNTNMNPVELYPYPELTIQSAMLTHFAAWLDSGAGAVLVDEEVQNSRGRMDVRISRFVPGGAVAINILELKVLNPKQYHKAHRKWAESGITQADDYRKSTENAEASHACIFDARIDKSQTIEGLETLAKTHDVGLFFMDMEVPQPKKKKAGRGG